jgi:hypothetical protein
MGNLINQSTVDEKRLERFLGEVRDYCRSSKAFKKKIEIDVSHIAFRAAQANQEIRNAITPEQIASLILHGELHRQTCKVSSPLEIVLDGRFAESTIPRQSNPLIS